MLSNMRALTNCPGHKASSWSFGKFALSRIVPVVVSIWLSITASVPSPKVVLPSRPTASTLSSDRRWPTISL